MPYPSSQLTDLLLLILLLGLLAEVLIWINLCDLVCSLEVVLSVLGQMAIAK